MNNLTKWILFTSAFLVVASQGYGQYMLAQDVERQKIKKVKIGKAISIITKTDTLDWYGDVYNEETRETETVFTGKWYVSNINVDESSIELWNNLDEQRVTIPTSDIELLSFKLENRGIHRKVLLGVAFGGIAWAAISKDNTQSIAAVGVTLASTVYLVATIGRTKYRQYKFFRLVR